MCRQDGNRRKFRKAYHSDNRGVPLHCQGGRPDGEETILVAINDVCQVTVTDHDELFCRTPEGLTGDSVHAIDAKRLLRRFFKLKSLLTRGPWLVAAAPFPCKEGNTHCLILP